MSDEFQITNGPDQKYYKKYNKNIFFSYPSSSSTSFQSGYLGIGPSKISGFLHIRSPVGSPLLVYRIQISLIGVESYRTGIRKCINQDDDRNNPKNERNLFYKKTKLAWLSCPAQRTSSLPKATEVSNLDVRFEFKLDDEMPTSFKTSKNFLGMRNGSIKYFIVAEVYTQSKKFVSPNHQVLKNVQVEVPIVRWSLPSEKKSSHGFETIVRKRKALYEPVQSILDQSSYDLNSTIRMTIMILFPKPGLFIKEVIGCIEEQHQIFKTDSDEVPMVIKRKVALQKINGAEVKKLSLSSPSSANVMNDDDSDTASIDDEEENYMFEVKMKIPSKEENVISPTMIDNPMVSRRVLHKIKIKVKFNNFRELKIERDVEIRNSLSQKRIEDGRAKGEIY